MDHKRLAKDVLRLVGGESNVESVTNCMTRLRFGLKDPAKADVNAIKALDGVQGVVDKNGQFQIVIGTEVGSVCDEVKKLGNFGDQAVSGGGGDEKTGPAARFFGLLTAIFQPIIPALAGSGMIKAFLALLVAFKLVDSASQTYAIFNAFGDALFYFMPFILAASAANVFKCNKFIALALAGVLLHPSFTALNTGDPVSLFGLIPVTMVSYASSVVPILLIVWVQSLIEPVANKYSPGPVKVFLAPMVTIILTGIIGLVIAGPLGNLVGQVIAIGFDWMNTYAGWLIPVVMGAFCPFFVMTGMHYCFAPIQTIQYATLGYGTILGPGMLASNIAQGAASLVVGLRSKNGKRKQVAISSGVTALMGITEPALYGVTMPLKRPLYAVMIGGGVAGLYAGITGIHTYSSTTAGIFALPVYIGGDMNNVINAAITMVISFVVTAIATFVLGFDDEAEADAAPADATPAASGEVARIVELDAPVAGEAIALSEVNDDAISQGLLGKGAAVIPSEGSVVAPADGVVTALFETGHAVGIRTNEGVEVLIHVGLDTVELKGRHFTTHVKQGDAVTRGQLLVSFDNDAIKAEGYDTVTAVLVTNADAYLDVVARTGRPAGPGLVKVINE